MLVDLIAKYEGNFWVISEPSRNLHGLAGLSSLWAIDSGTVESYLPCKCSHTPSVLKKSRKLHVYPQGCLSASIHSFKHQQSPPPFWNSPRDCQGSRGPRSNKEPFHGLSGQPSLIWNVRSYVLSEAGLATAPGQSSGWKAILSLSRIQPLCYNVHTTGHPLPSGHSFSSFLL